MLVSYFLIRLLTRPFAFLPYSTIHRLGKLFGTLAYHLFPKFRKRALANLSLAYELKLKEEEIPSIAKASLQSLFITLLEYPKLAREKDIQKIVTCENPEEADHLMEKGKGIVFFCGHQANWELLFLEGTSRMPGVAIGRPIKNKYLYNWILAIRQKFGGTIVSPKNGIKEGLRALRQGKFMGIVGDQGMPDSGFSSDFLGRKAWTSPAPALLAYKTGAPLIVATTRRENTGYVIHYSDPIFPNQDTPKEEEVERMMQQALALYAKSIKERPHEWLWIHNRWKQQLKDTLPSPCRHDSIALFFSDPLPNDLSLLRKIYPTEELTLFVPKQCIPSINAHIAPYENENELFQDNYRFKLIYNFTKNRKIEAHYKRLAAQNSFSLQSISELEKLCQKTAST